MRNDKSVVKCATQTSVDTRNDNSVVKGVTQTSVEQGRSRGSPLSLIERFSKDDTMPLTTPKRGKNDVKMP